MAVVITLTIQILAAAFFLCGVVSGNGWKTWKKVILRPATILVIAGLIGLQFALLWALLGQNQFVYCWDYGDYWTRTYMQSRSLFSAPVEALKSLVTSLRYDEYNLLLPALLALPVHIFGESFTAYVKINYCLFLAPSILILTLACLHSARVVRTSVSRFILAALFTITFPVLSFAMLRGYIDVAVLLPASITLLILPDYEPLRLDKRQLGRDIYLGLLLLAGFLFRRYFAYFGVGIAAAVFFLTIENLFRTIRADRNQTAAPIWEDKNLSTATIHVDKNLAASSIRAAIINLACTAAAPIFVLAVFLRPLLIRTLSGNFSLAYAGYDLPVKEKIGDLAYVFGLLIFILALLGLILGYVRKRARRNVTLLAVSTLVTTALFFRVQSMGIHHMYLISSQILVLAFTGLVLLIQPGQMQMTKLLSGLKGSTASGNKIGQQRSDLMRLLGLLLAAMYFINTAYVYIPTAAGWHAGDSNASDPWVVRTQVETDSQVYHQTAAARAEDASDPEKPNGSFMDTGRGQAPGLFSLQYQPLVRNDLQSLEELESDLAELSGRSYVAAASFLLNRDLIASLHKPQEDTDLAGLLYTADVDLRDGFPTEALTADYIVVTTPIQTYLKPGAQEVVAYIARSVRDQDSPLGRHFKKLDKAYQLDDNVTAYIYERTSEISEDDRAEIAAYFTTLYPEVASWFELKILQ